MAKRLSECDLCRIHGPESAGQGKLGQWAMLRQDSFAKLKAAEMHQLVPDRVSRHGLEMHLEQSHGGAEPLGDGGNRQLPIPFGTNHVLDCARHPTGIAQVLRCVPLKHSLYAVGDPFQDAS